MVWALIDANNNIVNTIAYDGTSPYTPPDGLRLADVELPVITQPLPSLAERREAVWDGIKAKRDYLTQNGGYKVTIDGVDKWFHSDIISRTQQMGLLLMGSNMPSNINWKTMDGTFVAMTPVLAQQIFNAAAASDLAIFATAEAHRAAVMASATPETYDYSGGWPDVYQSP